jgi:ATP/maltotriose-dependent transcriptional regulator MalT
MGDIARSGHLTAMLALVLVDQGRLDEAEEYVEVARETVPDIDVGALALVKISAARVLVRRGEPEEATRLAAEAIELVDETQELLLVLDLLMWQAEVLELAGRIEDAEAALRKVTDAAARKGALVDERRARERLAALTRSESEPQGRLDRPR